MNQAGLVETYMGGRPRLQEEEVEMAEKKTFWPRYFSQGISGRFPKGSPQR